MIYSGNCVLAAFSMLDIAIYLAIYLAGYLLALGIPQTLIHAHSALGRTLKEKRKKQINKTIQQSQK